MKRILIFIVVGVLVSLLLMSVCDAESKRDQSRASSIEEVEEWEIQVLQTRVISGSLAAKDINGVKNTIFCIQGVFDIPKDGIRLGANSVLKFEGGALRNGTITLQNSNKIVSLCDLPCFENVIFKGSYANPFKLSWLGVIGDGNDKSAILKKLPQILPYGIQNLILEGRVVCAKNEINIPLETQITGNGRSVLLFMSESGEYCISLSEGCSLYGVTIANNNPEFKGAIIYSSNEIVDNLPDGESRLKGCANIKLRDVKIKGANDSKGNSHSTAFGILARRYDDSKTSNSQHLKHRYDFFTNIILDDVYMTYVRYGICAEVDNNSHPATIGNKHYAWGNEINSSLLYVKSSDSGFKFVVRGNNKVSGSCKFSNYTYQANYFDRREKKYEMKAFEIDNVSSPIMFSLMRAWDCEDETLGDVRNSSVVYIDNDGFTVPATAETKKDHQRVTVARNRIY